MPFLVCRQGECRIDERDDLLREIGRASIPHPLRIAPVGQETYQFQPLHVPRHARLGHVETVHQLAHAVLFAVPNDLQGAEPRRLGKRV